MKWNLDPSHSEVQFKVRHLMITNVTGKIEKFSAEVESDDDKFTNAKIKFSADMNSISTGDAQRDGHLKSGDFFETEKFPTLDFTNGRIEGDKLHGDLTIKGITKPVALDVDFGGAGKDPWGNLKAGFSVSGKIQRSAWELNWNAALEAGGVLVSDDVRIAAEIQLVQG
jgi:polyisoprenoid-binding protein YceI